MKITLIAALDKHRGIGANGALPWRLPADLQFFRQMTMGKPMLMGRKTWESLPGLLPGRPHLVLSRDSAFDAAGAQVLHSVGESLNQAALHSDELMVIGGAQIYATYLPLADQLLLTEVDARIAADAWFPAFEEDDWLEVSREPHAADAENPLAYTFVRYLRRLPGS